MAERKQQNKPNENPEHNDLTDPIPNEELKENMNDENTNASKEMTLKANGITTQNRTPHKTL